MFRLQSKSEITGFAMCPYCTRTTNALCLSNYLDSLDTFPSKSISRFPRRDPDLSHPRSHFFYLLILTLSHGLLDKQGSFCLGKRDPVERRG
jgi:hypothetical protein